MSIGSQYCMPILVLNMGGEMIYILNQRLQAQNIPVEKARKVLGDVLKHMYTTVFLDELFKPQEMYSVASTKQIFDKLAHSSIMRLNKTSMDKLFDLMTMGVKYQVLACKAPHQLLQVTLNHLDALMELIQTDSINDMIKSAVTRCIELYSSMTAGSWILLEECLYRFFQGKKVKVSLFLQRKIQTVNGALVLDNTGVLPIGAELPGDVRYFEGNKIVRGDDFPSPLRADCVVATEVLEPGWPIGLNVYSKESDLNFVHGGSQMGGPMTAAAASAAASVNGNDKPGQMRRGPSFQSTLEASKAFSRTGSFLSSPLLAPSKSFDTHDGPGNRAAAKFSTQLSAKAGLGMLSDLLGVHTASAKGGVGGAKSEDRLFKINLFPNEGFNEIGGAKGDGDAKGGGDASGGSSGFITLDIDGSAGAKTLSTYEEILEWRDDEDGGYAADAKGGGVGGDDDDLLALMDSAK